MFYTNVTRSKNELLVRGYDKGRDGHYTRYRTRTGFDPVFYVPTSDPNAVYHDVITGKALSPVQCTSMYDASDFIKRNSGFSQPMVFGRKDYIGSYINRIWPTSPEYDDASIRVAFLDIEVSMVGGKARPDNAWQPVTAFTVGVGGQYWSVGTKDFVPNKKTIKYKKAADEKALLATLGEMLRILDVDVVSGWNTSGYDLPYLINRCETVLGEGQSAILSPWKLPGKVTFRTDRFQRVRIDGQIPGISSLDYLLLYKKFVTTQREEYTLDYISRFELGDSKTEYANDYDSLDTLYEKNHQLFMEYNVHDVELVYLLDQKLQFMPLVFSIAYDAKVNYDLVLGSVAMWETIIHNHILKKKQVASIPESHGDKSGAIAGAYVKPIVPGIYRSVASFDASSLYPSLIRMLNISPDTLTGDHLVVSKDDIHGDGWDWAPAWAKEHNVSVAGSGFCFTNEKIGFLPELMEEYYQKKQAAGDELVKLQREYQRTNDPVTKAKADRIAQRRSAIKVLINSCYGSTATPFFQFFDIRLAESVTLSGQLLIQETARAMNEHVDRLTGIPKDRVIGSDTDSIYIDCADITLDCDELEKVCANDFGPYLEKVMMRIKQLTNAVGPPVIMAREVIADKALWVAGKNYAIRMISNKGVVYAHPKYKVMGLQAVRSTTPSLVRKYMNGAIELILDQKQDDLNAYIAKCKAEYMSAGVREIAKSGRYKADAKVRTQAIKAAELYNAEIVRRKLTDECSKITDGDKLRIVELMRPNPFNADVFGFPNGHLPDLGVEPYIDRESMFSAYFLDVVTKWCDIANLTAKRGDTLADFFS